MPLKPTYQELMAKIESLEEELRARRQTGVPGAGEGEVGYPNLESLLHSIINNTQNVIYVKGVDGRFLLVNNNFCSIFDLREEVVIGKTPLELFPRDVAFQHLENDRRIIATGEPATFNEQAPIALAILSHCSGPAMNRAVEAASASEPFSAITVVERMWSTGMPVRGSMMWE